MAAGGDALAREPSGRVVFVAGALPGERVRARITHDDRDYAKAVVLDVLEASPARVTPPCPNVDRGCGGCSWQHVRADHQLELKVGIVRDGLRRTAKLPDALVVPGPSLPATAFRTTVRLTTDADGRLGYRARRSHDVVTVGTCLVAHPLIDELIGTVCVRGAAEVTARCGARTGQRAMAWTARAGGGARSSGVPPDVRRGWTSSITEVVSGHRLRASMGSFMQASPETAEALVAAVRDASGDELPGGDGRVIDAYGGVGLFAVTAVPPEAELVLVESSPSACADARVNLAGRAATVVQSTVESWRPLAAALVIADPARRGLGRGGVVSVSATGCRRLVLVSCDPVAMARDAVLLAAEGFVHAGSTVLDPFPHTPHVEVVTRFDRPHGLPS